MCPKSVSKRYEKCDIEMKPGPAGELESGV